MFKRLYWLGFLGIVCFSVLACWFNLKIGVYRFGGYDLSPLIDAGWRICSGQAPYSDFICTLPPSLYLLVGAAFKFGGVSWHSLLLASSLTSLIFILLGLRIIVLVRSSYNSAASLFIFTAYSVGILEPLFAVNHPWHSTLAQSFIVYAALGTFAAITAKSPTRLQVMELSCHLTIAYAGLLLSKPNTAFPALALCIFCLILAKRTRFAAVISMLTLGVASLALGIVHASLLQMLQAYSGLTGRILPRYFFIFVIPSSITVGKLALGIAGLETLTVYFILCPVFALCLRLYWQQRTHLQFSATQVLGWGCCLVSLIGLGTNVDLKIVDVPAMLLGITILTLDHTEFTSALRGRHVAACLSLLFLAFFFGLTRARMSGVGKMASDECGPRVLFYDSFFGRFHNCALLPELLHEVDSTIASDHPAKIFFGPRLEFLYARDGVASPRQLPLWWHPGSSYSTKDQNQIVGAWEKQHFDLLIFFAADRTGLPAPILRDIESNFHRVQSTDAIEVYRPN